MIYAYDQYAQMPTRDLYDSAIMQMAIGAAKDMYDKGEREIEKFRDKYGSFYSPTQSHMDYYNQNFDVSSFIDDLYNRGIDPLRSSEGRAAVRRWINTRPVARLEQMKKSAETYEKYQDSIADLQKKGLYNPIFQNFILGGKDINSLKEGEVWDIASATPYQDLNQYTGHLFDKMEDSFIESDPETGLDWYGVSRQRREEALTPAMQDLLSTDIGRFHYAQSKAAAERLLGRPLTEAEAMQTFRNDVLAATTKYEHRTPKENAAYKRKAELQDALTLDNARTNNDIRKEKELRKNTSGFDSKGAAIPGSGNNIKNSNIFREAEYRATQPGKLGDYTQYEASQQYYQYIDPVHQPDDIVILKDKDSGETRQVYKYSNKSMKNIKMYKADSDGNLSRRYITSDDDKDYTFIPIGGMQARFVNGRYEYYISGRFVDGDGKPIEGYDGSGTTYLIPVKERLGNYGQTQKSK